MLTRRAFIAPLVLGLVALSVWMSTGTTKRVATGTVVAYRAGESISVVADGIDPHPIALRDTTAYEGDRATIKTGARVTIWCRYVGERRPIADKVRVLASTR
jgi:hypothetical protein